MSKINQQIVLKERPKGAVKPTDFSLIETPVRPLKKGEILLKTVCFSLDPYMRSRMNDIDSYVKSFELDAPLSGGSICVVEESKNPNVKVGDYYSTLLGWQTYAIITPTLTKSLPSYTDQNEVCKLPAKLKPSLFLGALGMPGFTAYHGLLEIGQPKPGEVVVVSAATGAVGSIVGQLAKIKGCRVVGIAGGSEKCQYAIKTLGFDACVDHQSSSFKKDLKKVCSKGIDIYYENVGGPIFSAVLPLLNLFSRVAVCGAIHWYNDMATLREKKFSINQLAHRIMALFRLGFHFDQTPQILLSMIGKRIKYQGFINGDHLQEYDKFLKEIVPLVKSNKIKYKEDIVKGIENAPTTFARIMNGKNFGKIIIEI